MLLLNHRYPPFHLPHAASPECVSCIHLQEFTGKPNLVSRKEEVGEGSAGC